MEAGKHHAGDLGGKNGWWKQNLGSIFELPDP